MVRCTFPALKLADKKQCIMQALCIHICDYTRDSCAVFAEKTSFVVQNVK